MYVLDWGGGFGRHNPDSGLHRIDYVSGSRSPSAVATATPDSGQAPLEVTFDGTASSDPEGEELSYAWDFDGDGEVDATEPVATTTYTENGVYNARLTVTDPHGKTGTTVVPVTVGNTRPEISFDLPPTGAFFDFGDVISWDIDAFDAEEEIVDEDIIVQPALGHDEHAHPAEPFTGRTGSVATSLGGGHSEDMNVFYVLDARYEDSGGVDGVPSLTGEDTSLLFAKIREAEFYAESEGVTASDSRDIEGHGTAISGQDGAWASYEPVNLINVDQLLLRVASATGGDIELRRDAPDGDLLATAEVPSTGGLARYIDVPVEIEDPGESFTLYVVFPGEGERRLNFFEADGKGVSPTTKPRVAVTAPTASDELEVGEITVSAEATDAENEITQVEFFVDGESIGVDEEAPYSVTWEADEESVFQLTAVATNDNGVSTTSRIVPVTIGEPGPDPEPGPGPRCEVPMSDEFDGDELDTNRWSTVRAADGEPVTVADGALHLPVTAGDIDGANTGPISYVGQPMPEGVWEAEAQVTLEHERHWQFGGLMMHSTDDDYAKVAFTQHEDGSRFIEFWTETDGSRNSHSPNVTLPADAPSTVHLKLFSAGENLRAAYSLDGEEWTELEGASSVIPDATLGLVAAGDTGGGGGVAVVDHFHVTPDRDGDTEREPNDEFDGDALDGCRWDRTVRYVEENVSVSDGELHIDTQLGDINNDNPDSPENFILQSAPEGDWTVETRFRAPLEHRWQYAGLLAYGSDDEYVKLDVVARNEPGQPLDLGAELVSEVDGSFGAGGNSAIDLDGQPEGDYWHLRLSRTGDSYEGWVSEDGESWTSLGEPVTHAGDLSAVGLVAIGPEQTAPVTVSFDYFRVVEDGEEPGEDVDAPVVSGNVLGRSQGVFVPEDRDPGNIGGTATLVKTADGTEVSVRVTGLLPGNSYPAHLHDGACHDHGGHYMHDPNGVPAPPNEIWVSSDNDPRGSLVPNQQGIAQGWGDADWVARQQPLSIHVHEPQPPGPPIGCPELAAYDAPATLVLEADDGEGSGVDTVEYSLDGGDWVAYDGEVEVSEPGSHTVTFRATDAAGNVSEVEEMTFAVAGDEAPEPVEVTPADVTFDDQPGTDSDTFTVPETEGVEYLVDGEVVEAGTYPGSGEVTVTARALEGFVLAEGATTEWTHTFSTEGGEPEPVEVTPADVTFDDQTGTDSDTLTVPETQGVEYLVDGEVVEAGTYPGSGEVTVTARALEGFVLAEGATTEWTHTFSTEGEEPEPVEVTPAAVTFTDRPGFALDTFTVPAVEGVEYVIDGEVVGAGTYAGVGTVTVTARALDGFVLAEGATTEWAHTFSTAGSPPDTRTAEFHLSNTWRGTTDVHFMYGRWADEVFIGDWDGDGRDTIAVRRGNQFHVTNGQRGGDADVVFTYGRPGDVVLVGDWDGDGRDSFAVRRGASYHINNSLRGGNADTVVTYGRGDDTVLVGDWDGDGVDTFAVRRGATYHVKNSLRGGDADVVFTYGRSGDVVLVGDWDGDGDDTLAVQRGRTFHVNNSLRGGDADRAVTFGRLGDEVHVGDWDGNGTDTLGIRRPVGGGVTATGFKPIGMVSKAG